MSAREELQELLDQARAAGRPADYVDGVRDALDAVVAWQRSSSRYGAAAADDPEKRAQRTQRTIQRRKRLNDELIKTSMNRRMHYTYSEWLVIKDSDLTAQEVARQLGRTYRGIMHARARLRRGHVPSPG